MTPASCTRLIWGHLMGLRDERVGKRLCGYAMVEMERA